MLQLSGQLDAAGCQPAGFQHDHLLLPALAPLHRNWLTHPHHAGQQHWFCHQHVVLFGTADSALLPATCLSFLPSCTTLHRYIHLSTLIDCWPGNIEQTSACARGIVLSAKPLWINTAGRQAIRVQMPYCHGAKMPASACLRDVMCTHR